MHRARPWLPARAHTLTHTHTNPIPTPPFPSPASPAARQIVFLVKYYIGAVNSTAQAEVAAGVAQSLDYVETLPTGAQQPVQSISGVLQVRLLLLCCKDICAILSLPVHCPCYSPSISAMRMLEAWHTVGLLLLLCLTSHPLPAACW